MSPPAAWPLGLARMAQMLGRDLQRAARNAGGPERLWSADRAELGRLLRCAGAELAMIDRARSAIDVAADAARLERAGIAHVGMDDARYPAALRTLPDPPFGLFIRGAVEPVLTALAEEPVVAVVGCRRASPPGAAFARALGGALAERAGVVVSGLAHGIDAAAHEGALEAGGVTVAVLGCGVDVAYPRRNRGLALRIAGSGALVSEYWPGTPPAPWRFPARNRIVAGLSEAVAVVEAGRRSGALITADFCLELGRPVLAVPGWPGVVTSEGCNGLLRAGAALLETVDDVVAEIPGSAWREPPPPIDAPALEGLPRRLYDALQRQGAVDLDGLAEALGEEAGDISGALARLEIEGLVLRGPGQRFWAAPMRAARAS